MQRAYKAETSPTLDNVQRLADAAGLQPWQLLFPGLDPTNPPVAVGKSEFEMYAKIQRAFERLPPLTNVSA